MNLVQIQERLKDAPVQAVMQYANGQNPMVAPYLALAELKRRESINQSAQSQQAMQQGQSPSVKEQIEQAAGLAALQQQMQQQGMQGLMAQARPQGIPEGIPQPRRQPESEGIAGLPSGDFNFADGGIVAFSKGGDEGLAYRSAMQARQQKGMEESIQEQMGKDPLIEQLEAQRREAMQAGDVPKAMAIRRQMTDIQSGKAPRPMQQTPSVPAASLEMEQTVRAPSAVAQQPSGIAAALSPKPAAEPATRAAGAQPTPFEPPQFKLDGDYQSAMQDVMAIRDPAERAAAFQALQRTQPAGQAPAQGLAALPGADEAQKRMLETMRAKPDITQGAEEYRKAQGLFGLAQPYGEDRMKRIQEMQEARKKELSDRDMERLMRVLGGIAGRGLQGAGPAYLQAVGDERAADAAFRKQMDELMGGVEEKRRAEAVSGMTEAQKQIQEQQKRALESAGKIMDADTQFKLQELQRKAVLGRLSAEEEYIRGEILKGRKYPEIIEELARAKGATRTEADVQKAQLKREAEWNEISGDILRRQEWAKLGVRTLEDYLRYVQRSSGGAGGAPAAGGAQQNRPPLSSFKG